jgi:hypothetical protein
MKAVWMSALLAVCLGAAACDNVNPLQPDPSGSCDASAVAVDVAIDSTVGVSATTTGYLVPLVVTATIPCLEGSAHALVETGAGQFSASGTPAVSSEAGVANAIPSLSDAGADGASDASTEASTSSAAPASTAAPGATTTILLTPTGQGSTYLGFTTLLLAGVPLSTRIQVSVGDALACETVGPAADAAIRITESKTCAQ